MNPTGIYRRLRETLIEAYPDEWQVRQLMRDAGLDTGDTAFHGRARQTWDEALQVSIRCRKLDVLLALALEERPDNRDLGEAVAEWQALSPEDQVEAGQRLAVSASPTRPTIRPPVPDFTGRVADIAALVAAFSGTLSQDGGSPTATATATITGIRGMGGIGKTELALAVAHALAGHYPDAALSFELQPGDVPLAPEALLAAIIHTFQPELRLSGS